MTTLKSNQNLIWIDLEMTGLDPEQERIIEIATIITDNNLTIIAEGPNLVIYQPKELLENMDTWNKNQHGNSGLIKSVNESSISDTSQSIMVQPLVDGTTETESSDIPSN